MVPKHNYRRISLEETSSHQLFVPFYSLSWACKVSCTDWSWADLCSESRWHWCEFIFQWIQGHCGAVKRRVNGVQSPLVLGETMLNGLELCDWILLFKQALVKHTHAPLLLYSLQSASDLCVTQVPQDFRWILRSRKNLTWQPFCDQSVLLVKKKHAAIHLYWILYDTTTN